ncbi:MAG: hypothetical protein J1E40_01760 [Oscillospiraceae bacterium]|nr:hypothetical protein [Oscillospiraceae bacterium]
MMDIFVEQIVKKITNGKDMALKILIIIAMCVLTLISLFVFFFIMPVFGFVVFSGAMWGGYYLFTNLDCEYEYIVTNGEIDIDKIIARRKRVRLITAKASAFEAFGEYDSAPEIDDDVTIVSAVGSNESDAETKIYYADFKHASAGSVRLIFSPEEKVIDAIVPFLPRQLKVNFKK